MIVAGLTGGIGSGKSVVASLLRVCGIPVYIADDESKRLTLTSPAIREGLTGLFGKEIYLPDGLLDKRLLASCIFNDAKALEQVNAIIHPEVKRHFQEWVARQTSGICVMESAILFESGFQTAVDISVMVYAPPALRISRVMGRDAVSQQDVMRRIGNQMPDEKKKELSDYVICNDGKHPLIPQVTGLFLKQIPQRPEKQKGQL